MGVAMATGGDTSRDVNSAKVVIATKAGGRRMGWLRFLVVAGRGDGCRLLPGQGGRARKLWRMRGVADHRTDAGSGPFDRSAPCHPPSSVWCFKALNPGSGQ